MWGHVRKELYRRRVMTDKSNGLAFLVFNAVTYTYILWYV